MTSVLYIYPILHGYTRTCTIYVLHLICNVYTCAVCSMVKMSFFTFLDITKEYDCES